nr:hypothetical protein [uncultured Draconibacterium sp.]
MKQFKPRKNKSVSLLQKLAFKLCPPVFFAVYMLLLSINGINTFGQTVVVEKTQPASLDNNVIIGNSHPCQNQLPNHYRTNEFSNIQRNHQALMNEVDQHLKQLMTSRDYSNISSRQINYDLPDLSPMKGTEYFHSAFNEIHKMLTGATPPDLKKAIYTVENAYFEGRLSHDEFDKKIQNLIETAKLKATQDGYDWNNPQVRNIMLFRVIADTLKIKSNIEEKVITSYPMQYDFEDYSGKEDWSKMFVSKLLATHSGQCHSLPLLYLILCEETNTSANLALSPSHSYAKFKDQNGDWHNLELTNGRIVSDAFILGSGYITAEALKNHLYMEPLTTEQTVAQCLADLAKSYSRKYGFDGFVSQCVDTTLKYAPENMYARMIKSDYQTMRFEYVVNQVGRPRPDILKSRYPKIYQLLAERDQTYQFIDRSGYQEMPAAAYEAWLNSVKKEKEKQEQQMFHLTPTIK